MQRNPLSSILGKVLDFLNRFAPFVHWAPRLALAGIFIPQGYSKFVYPGMIPPPLWQLVGAMELLGSLFIIVGAFGRDLLTRLAGLVFLVVMTGASVMLYQPSDITYELDAPKIWIGPLGGLDLQVLAAAVALYFLVKGNQTGGPPPSRQIGTSLAGQGQAPTGTDRP